jgi:hypothetical protein
MDGNLFQAMTRRRARQADAPPTSEREEGPETRVVDALARWIAEGPLSRRRVFKLADAAIIGGVLSAALSRFGVSPASAQEAANHFGCVHVSHRCTKSGQCCSGVCKGKEGHKTCRAHNVGTCTRDRAACTTETPSPCNPNNLKTACFVTTGNGLFCADLTPDTVPPPACEPCLRDLDCLVLGYPPGSACVVYDGEFCPPGTVCAATSGRACVHPGT